MANRTYAVHTNEDNIRRLDEHAKALRRSRNSLMNEAIEILLERFDATGKRRPATKPTKAGTR